MDPKLPVKIPRQLARAGLVHVPAVILATGEQGTRRFFEFFTANIRNKNTRVAYYRAVLGFFEWCEHRGIGLDQVQPVIVAAYVEELQLRASPPTVKQHLSAIRMLFDWLVIGQIIPASPASSVRGPKYVVKKGKTPVLSAADARLLLDSIAGLARTSETDEEEKVETNDVVRLRDRALIGVMVYSFARVSAVIHMRVKDYFPNGKRY